MAQCKQQARSAALSRREGLNDTVRTEKSALIAQRLFGLELFQKARCVFIYIAVCSEVHTAAIVQTALDLEKKVCVPLVDLKNKTMLACVITDPQRDLHSGAMGIPEPDQRTCPVVSEAEVDLAIVPGLAFTAQGHRIGYGGGFYDKFLSTWPGVEFALAFEEQIVDSLPHDPARDFVLSRIITDTRLIDCSSL